MDGYFLAGQDSYRIVITDLLNRIDLDITFVTAGKMTVNTRFGTKVAVLAGDFLFAQSSWFLANLDNLEVSAKHPLCSCGCHFCKSIMLNWSV